MPAPTINGQWEIAGLLIGQGTLYPIDEVQGLGMPEVRAAEIQFVDRDGGHSTRERLASREIVLAIGVDGDPDTAGYATLIDNLASALRPSDSDVLARWRRFGRTRRVTARPRGLVLPWDDPFHLGAARVACRLICLDPVIYEEAETVVAGTGAQTATNNGNYAVYPVVTITGPSAGVTLRNNSDGGKQIVLVDLSGTTTVDFKTLTVTVGGAARPQAVQPGSLWWRLLPGSNSLQLDGAGSFSVAFRSGWVTG